MFYSVIRKKIYFSIELKRNYQDIKTQTSLIKDKSRFLNIVHFERFKTIICEVNKNFLTFDTFAEKLQFEIMRFKMINIDI